MIFLLISKNNSNILNLTFYFIFKTFKVSFLKTTLAKLTILISLVLTLLITICNKALLPTRWRYQSLVKVMFLNK
jgi:hypothetical protein